MSNSDARMQALGAWLAIASALLGAGLILHGPIHPDHTQQMKAIAEDPNRWVIAHWVSATALSALAVAGLIALASGSRLNAGPSTISAWGVLPVGALWTVTTAVAEATAVTDAAIAGNTGMFAAWWAFAEGKATGFMFVALAFAVIAGNEARSASAVTPVWASWIAVVAGVGAVFGWIAGMWLGIGGGSLVWLIASLVLSLWVLWFGLALTRRVLGQPAQAGASPSARGREA